MPDADGRIKGFAPTRKTAEAWERIFSGTVKVLVDPNVPPDRFYLIPCGGRWEYDQAGRPCAVGHRDGCCAEADSATTPPRRDTLELSRLPKGSS